MKKVGKTRADILALVKAELERHMAPPDGLTISVIPLGSTWELRTNADEAAKADVGYGECVAKIVQIGDQLSREFDLID